MAAQAPLGLWLALHQTGLAAALPAAVTPTPGTTLFYKATDTGVLSEWNPTTNSWDSYSPDTVAGGITAGTTHSLAGATPLTAKVNFVTTVANASDAVALPSAVNAVGLQVTIFNSGVAAAAVWPQAADTIDGGSAGAAVTLTNAKRCTYIVSASGKWISAQLGVVSA